MGPTRCSSRRSGLFAKPRSEMRGWTAEPRDEPRPVQCPTLRSQRDSRSDEQEPSDMTLGVGPPSVAAYLPQTPASEGVPSWCIRGRLIYQRFWGEWSEGCPPPPTWQRHFTLRWSGRHVACPRVSPRLTGRLIRWAPAGRRPQQLRQSHACERHALVDDLVDPRQARRASGLEDRRRVSRDKRGGTAQSSRRRRRLLTSSRRRSAKDSVDTSRGSASDKRGTTRKS
jgi:hypothetical protein